MIMWLFLRNLFINFSKKLKINGFSVSKWKCVDRLHIKSRHFLSALLYQEDGSLPELQRAVRLPFRKRPVGVQTMSLAEVWWCSWHKTAKEELSHHYQIHEYGHDSPELRYGEQRFLSLIFIFLSVVLIISGAVLPSQAVRCLKGNCYWFKYVYVWVSSFFYLMYGGNRLYLGNVAKIFLLFRNLAKSPRRNARNRRRPRRNVPLRKRIRTRRNAT